MSERRKSSVASLRRGSRVKSAVTDLELETAAAAQQSRFSYHLTPLDEAFRFDPTLAGPLKGRACTDKYACLIITIFFASWGIIAGYAFINGNLDVLGKPVQTLGSICGNQEITKYKPYLFHYDFLDCIHPKAMIGGCRSEKVCVSQCPNETFFFDLHQNQNISNTTKMMCNFSNKTVESINNFTKYQEYSKYVNWEKSPESNLKCSKYYFNSDKEFSKKFKHCIPDVMKSKIFDSLEIYTSRFGMSELMSMFKVHIVTTYEDKLNGIIIADALKGYPIMITLLCFSVIFCFMLTFVMKYLAKFTIWISVISIICILCICIYYSYTFHSNKNSTEMYNNETVIGKTFQNLKYHQYFKTVVQIDNIFLYIGIGSSVLGIIFLLFLIFLRNHIKLACKVIEETSFAIYEVKTIVFFPFITKIIQIAVIAFSISVAVYLLGAANETHVVTNLSADCACNVTSYKNGDTCYASTFPSYCEQTQCKAECVEEKSRSRLISFMQIFNFIAFFISSIFVSALGEMVISSTFATWYWTFHKSDIPLLIVTRALRRTIRYHSGTVAFGIFIVAIFQIMRYTVEFFDRVSIKYVNVFDLLEYLNSYILIMCAIFGKNFWESAKHICELIWRNIVRFLIVTGIAKLLFFIVNIGLSVGMASIAYVIFLIPAARESVELTIIPIIIVFLGTFAFGEVFFHVYTTAIKTILLCFFEDTETNDGSFESPFFMPDSLMDINVMRNLVPRSRYDHHT